MSYTIRLPQFEGPFDLLLFFIERDELDIYDIPISQVTNDFLAYMRQADQMDIDLASEFVLVASTLCRIKAKMLIPRKPVDEEGNEIDPREELVHRLLEYKRYKSVLQELRELETRRGLRSYRGNVTEELEQLATKALVDVELESVTLFKLLRAYERMMARLEEANKRPVIHEVAQFPHTIEEEQDRILGLVSGIQFGKDKPGFSDIFGSCTTRLHAIVTFLGLLELLNAHQVRLVGAAGVNDFYLEAGNPDEEE